MLSAHQITSATAVALALGAVAAPAASALPARDAPNRPLALQAQVAQAPTNGGATSSLTYSRQTKQLTPTSPSHVPAASLPAAAPAATSGSSFDWGDAAIGAAGGLVISVVGIGGALALSQRRTRRGGASAVATS